MTRAHWAEAILAVSAIAVGVVLVVRPFGSVRWLAVALAVALIIWGVSAALAARRSDTVVHSIAAAGLLVAGLVLLFWPGLSIFSIALVTAIGLGVLALSRLSTAISGSTVSRTADVLYALAAIALAVIALAWPGLTIYVTTLVAGLLLIWFGVARLWGLARPEPSPTEPGWGRRAVSLVVAAVAALVTVPLAVISVVARADAPEPDAFYSAPLDPSAAPGTLVRAEPFTREVPDDARAWRILYTTTRDEGVPALASGLVVAPKDPPPGPRPVIAWAHGTTGIAEGCAPSNLSEPFTAGATPALGQVIDNGWVLVATDYLGLGTTGPTPYVIGQGEARSVLDSVRAARQMPELELSDRTIVWGHSQGGHAALWTGALAPTYAPDVNVDAVAALAPAADLNALAEHLETMPGGSLFAAYVIDNYAANYPDVEVADYVKVQARLPFREMAARCLSSPSTVISVLEALVIGDKFFQRAPDEGPLGARLTENTLAQPLTMPLLLEQGETDTLIPPATQQAYVDRQCALGTAVEYRTYPDRDHLGIVADDSPAITELLAWTQARIDGVPAPQNC